MHLLTETEAPALSGRRENRETIRRLFQGYVKDFGPADGEKIIRVLIDELGGLRITVPKSSKHNGANVDAVWCLYCRLRGEFGSASAETIMRKFLADLGGMRISFPDFQDLAREERDRKICNAFHRGSSLNEIALAWGLSVPAVRWIVFGERDRRRN